MQKLKIIRTALFTTLGVINLFRYSSDVYHKFDNIFVILDITNCFKVYTKIYNL
jgi:hypothetical protein